MDVKRWLVLFLAVVAVLVLDRTASARILFTAAPELRPSAFLVSRLVVTQQAGDQPIAVEVQSGFFCNGDPVNGLDPDGRCVEGVIAGYKGAPELGNSSGTFNAAYALGSEVQGGVGGTGQGLKNDVGAAGMVISTVFGGPAAYNGVNASSDYAGFTDTSSLTSDQQLQRNTQLVNVTDSAQAAVFAIGGAYQAPQVTAPPPPGSQPAMNITISAPASNSGPVELQNGDVILAVVQNGQIIATSTPALSHAELVNRAFGGALPSGAEVVTIIKSNGQVTAITSMTFSGTQVPASSAAQAAAKVAYR